MLTLSRVVPLSLASLITAVLCSPSALAQIVGGQWEKLWQFDGAAANDVLGISVAGAGDADGDGFTDLVVGAHFADPGGLTNAGSAYVYSGATGSLIWQFDGTARDDQLGRSVSGAGDVDGDGFDDVIIGAGSADPGGLQNAGSAFVYSGATGGLIWRFDGAAAQEVVGASVSGAGDVDGDGFADVIVGANGAQPGGLTNAGSAYIYSGATGALIWQFDGTAVGDALGRSVSDAGDVDGDGFPDVIVGAPFTDPGGIFTTGSAYVYSGATGSLIWQFDGASAGEQFASSVSGAGDVDGDGFDDLVMGAWVADPGGLRDAGSASVYSGATGSLIWQFDGAAAGDHLGESVSGACDVDGDGFADVIVGAPFAEPGGLSAAGSAYLYSGLSGDLIRQFHGATVGDALGKSVSDAGDVDADDFPDLIVGAYSAGPGGLHAAGSAYVISLDPFLRTDKPELSASSGVPVQLGLDFPDTEAGKRFAILASAAGTGPTTLRGVDVPLSGDTLFWRTRNGWTPPVLTNNWGLLDREGNATVQILSDPVLAPYVGQTLYLAAIAWGPTPRLSSIARTLEIVP